MMRITESQLTPYQKKSTINYLAILCYILTFILHVKCKKNRELSETTVTISNYTNLANSRYWDELDWYIKESADKLQEVLVQEQEEQQLNIKAPSEEAEQQSTPVTESEGKINEEKKENEKTNDDQSLNDDNTDSNYVTSVAENNADQGDNTADQQTSYVDELKQWCLSHNENEPQYTHTTRVAGEGQLAVAQVELHDGWKSFEIAQPTKQSATERVAAQALNYLKRNVIVQPKQQAQLSTVQQPTSTQTPESNPVSYFPSPPSPQVLPPPSGYSAAPVIAGHQPQHLYQPHPHHMMMPPPQHHMYAAAGYAPPYHHPSSPSHIRPYGGYQLAVHHYPQAPHVDPSPYMYHPHQPVLYIPPPQPQHQQQHRHQRPGPGNYHHHPIQQNHHHQPPAHGGVQYVLSELPTPPPQQPPPQGATAATITKSTSENNSVKN